VIVLNSVGQTVNFFTVGDSLTIDSTTIALPANFDGVAVDAVGSTAVTTSSSFGGSQIFTINLATGSVQIVGFPGQNGPNVNPSKASLDTTGTAWIGGRGDDAVYRLDRGAAAATLVASGVGTFVERVVPVGMQLFAIDANIDDDGFTFQPLGPSRVVVLGQGGGVQEIVQLPATALDAVDAVVAGDRLVILAGGTFDAQTFAPNGDGVLLSLSLADRTLGAVIPLGDNGVSLELGDDGAVYVTSTSDFQRLDVFRFDPVGDAFVNGPGQPIPVVDGAGARVDCWVATAVADGRLLCVTFQSAQSGRLLLARADGSFIAERPSGFGSSDLLLRRRFVAGN